MKSWYQMSLSRSFAFDPIISIGSIELLFLFKLSVKQAIEINWKVRELFESNLFKLFQKIPNMRHIAILKEANVNEIPCTIEQGKL
jgi:hypothetical protein